MSKYLVIIERAGNNFSAFCPDLPGCVATGRTKRKAESRMKEAIEFHLEGLKKTASKLPGIPRQPLTSCFDLCVLGPGLRPGGRRPISIK